MDIVVRGRHLDVSEKFREHATTRLTRIEKFDPRMASVDVEVVKQQQPRIASDTICVELTCRSKGPVIRAEACAGDKFEAFDAALVRLEERLRRAHDRRLDHHRGSKAERIAVADSLLAAEGATALLEEAPADEASDLVEMIGDGPLVVREKFHDTTPMTLDDALHHMELVGHDFYAYVDKASELPSVVYRRKGYDYGVIRLRVDAD